jgi:hypothetical protein
MVDIQSFHILESNCCRLEQWNVTLINFRPVSAIIPEMLKPLKLEPSPRVPWTSVLLYAAASLCSPSQKTPLYFLREITLLQPLYFLAFVDQPYKMVLFFNIPFLTSLAKGNIHPSLLQASLLSSAVCSCVRTSTFPRVPGRQISLLSSLAFFR